MASPPPQILAQDLQNVRTAHRHTQRRRTSPPPTTRSVVCLFGACLGQTLPRWPWLRNASGSALVAVLVFGARDERGPPPRSTQSLPPPTTAMRSLTQFEAGGLAGSPSEPSARRLPSSATPLEPPTWRGRGVGRALLEPLPGHPLVEDASLPWELRDASTAPHDQPHRTTQSCTTAACSAGPLTQPRPRSSGTRGGHGNARARTRRGHARPRIPRSRPHR